MENHLPVIRRVVSVALSIRTTVKISTIVNWIVWSIKCIGLVKVNYAAIPIIGVVKVGQPVVIVVPVNAILKTVAVDI